MDAWIRTGPLILIGHNGGLHKRDRSWWPGPGAEPAFGFGSRV